MKFLKISGLMVVLLILYAIPLLAKSVPSKFIGCWTANGTKCTEGSYKGMLLKNKQEIVLNINSTNFSREESYGNCTLITHYEFPFQMQIIENKLFISTRVIETTCEGNCEKYRNLCGKNSLLIGDKEDFVLETKDDILFEEIVPRDFVYPNEKLPACAYPNIEYRR